LLVRLFSTAVTPLCDISEAKVLLLPGIRRSSVS
jgi:hypothetical protein